MTAAYTDGRWLGCALLVCLPVWLALAWLLLRWLT